jgi:aspartokinase-like uncharacterized kinase
MSDIEVVVKLGGGTAPESPAFSRALDAIATAATRAPLLVVPGGGSLADAVRELDGRVALSSDAAHWMAILAMDQYAWLIADKLPRALVAGDEKSIAGALRAGRIPVLAASRWLQTVDPLPHSWDVTSDSIAGWIASILGARKLVLIKPPGATGDAIVDPHFTAPAGLAVTIVPSDQITVADIIA